MILRLQIDIHKGNILTYNYQYPLSAFIYKTIAAADKDFASFLHNEGYQLNGKSFKHFTFSTLDFGANGRKHIQQSDRFYINTKEISLEIRFYMPKAAESFIVGLFNRQEFGLGDKLNKIDCRISRVETVATPDFDAESVVFKTQTPILLSEPRENRPARYLHPKHDENTYPDFFRKNLLNKWLSLGKEIPEGEVVFKWLPGEVKKQGITVKAHTENPLQIIPYHFNFSLQAPKEMLLLGYLSGFGLEGSLGLGCCGVVKPHT